MGFILQADEGVCTIEKQAVHLCALLDDDSIAYCTRAALQVRKYSITDNMLVPVGTVEFCRAWMQRIGVAEPQPLDYPFALKLFLGRSVCLYPRYSVAPNGSFVKPLATKTWEAPVKQTVTDSREYRGEGCRCEPDVSAWDSQFPGQVWASLPLKHNILAEWRVYVFEGKVVGVGRYDATDGERPFDLDYVSDVIRHYVASNTAPVAFAVDIGLLSDGAYIVIEVNDAWALGLYKCDILPMDRRAYRDMLKKRWAEIRADTLN